ncbi:MAG: hypothetical protein H3C34_02690 [Caldilineaceae bacterium]|nr:hypothetical protein [Caldilineaceae bacterium]
MQEVANVPKVVFSLTRPVNFDTIAHTFSRSQPIFGAPVFRYLLTFVVSFATIAWLVLSYLPASAAALPQLTFDDGATAWWFFLLAVLALALFIGVQVRIVKRTADLFSQPSHSLTGQSIRAFRLTRSKEIFWTALPLVATVALALWLLASQ